MEPANGLPECLKKPRRATIRLTRDPTCSIIDAGQNTPQGRTDWEFLWAQNKRGSEVNPKKDGASSLDWYKVLTSKAKTHFLAGHIARPIADGTSLTCDRGDREVTRPQWHCAHNP